MLDAEIDEIGDAEPAYPPQRIGDRIGREEFRVENAHN